MISSSSISKSLLLSTLVCSISLLSSRLAGHTIRLLSRLVAFVDDVLQAEYFDVRAERFEFIVAVQGALVLLD